MKISKKIIKDNEEIKLDVNNIVYKDLQGVARSLGWGVIVERGENEDGSYVKYGNGIMICGGEFYKRAIVDTEWAGMHYVAFGQQKYPAEFIEPAKFSASCVGDRMLFIGSYYRPAQDDEYKSKYTPVIEGYRPAKDTIELNHRVTYMAIGRWK